MTDAAASRDGYAAALEESEARYRLLFNAIDDGFCTFEMIFDPAGNAVDFRYIDANDGFEKQTGRRPRPGQTMRELFPEAEHMWLDLYGEVARTGEARRFVDFVGGLDRWYSVYVFPIGPSGCSRLGALFTDVTEAKRAEQALRESEAKFRTVFDSIDEGFAIQEIIYDEKGEIADIVYRQVNAAFERQGGLRDVVGRSLFEVLPSVEDHWLDHYRTVARTGRPVRAENHQQDVDRWFDVHFTRIDEEGRFVATVFNDITERKRSEQALRESEGRLARALEAGELGAWELDLATLEAWRSPQHDRIFGYEALLPEWTYDMFLGHVVPEDRAWVDARFQDAIAAAGQWDFECRIRRADGELRWISAQGRVDARTEAHPGRMKGMVRDVTERKGSELALRESEERQAFLLRLADTLRPLADPVEVQREAAAAIGRYFGAGRAAYAEIDADGGHFTVHRDYTDGVPSFAGRYPLADYGTDVLWANLVAGRTNVIADAEQDPRLGEAERSNYAASMVRAAVGVPLVKGGRLAATFFVHLPSPHEWRPDEVALVEETAERTWAALERARAEAALRESEEKFRTLFESIDEMFCIIEVIEDDDGHAVDFRYIEANEEHDRQSGLGHVVGKLASEVVPGAEAYWFESFGEVARTGEPKRYENYNKDTGRWYDVFLSRVGGAGSRRVCVVSHDTTERKQREARQAFLLGFSDALRTEPDEDAVANRAIAMLAQQMRLDRCYITVDRAHEDRADIRYQVGNDRVRALPDHIQPSSFPAALQMRRERTLVIDDIAATSGLTDADRVNIAALGMSALVSSAVRKGHGNPEWAIVGVSASPRSWTAGEVALAEEATERTWAAIQRARGEAALRNSEEKYRTLFDSIDEGFCIVEVIERSEGRPADYRLLEVNQAFERQTGLANVVGKLGSEVSGGTEDHWADAYEKVVRTGEPIRIESHHQGTGHWYDAFMTRVGGPGSRLVCMVFQDTTERRHREERQRFLLALGDAMRSQPSAESIVEAAGRLIAERLNPSRVLFAEFDEPNGTVTVFHAWTADGATPFPAVVRQEDFAGPILDDLRAGRMLRVDDAGDPPFDRPDLAALAKAGIKGALSVPLIIGGRLMATLSVHQHEARRWTENEVTLLQEVAERLWADVVRARAEEALRESEERYRALFETMDEAYAVVDVLKDDAGRWADFRFVQVNPAFLRHTSMPYPVAKTATELLGAPNPRWAQLYGQALDTNEPLRVEEDEPTLGRTFDLNIFSLDRERGRVAVLFTDITARKEAERALRESEERFRHLVEASAQAVWEAAPDGEIVEDSPSWRASTGQALGEWTGYGWLEAIHPDDRDYAEHNWRERIAAKRPVDAEFRLRRAGGGWGWTNVRAAPLLAPDGSVRKWIGMNIDIDARKQAEAALRESQATLAADLANAELLRDLAERLVTEENVGAIYDEILSAAVTVAASDAGTLQIYDAQAKSLEIIASKNFTRTITDYFHSVDASSRTACGIAMRTGERAFVDFPDEVEDRGCQLLVGEGIQSALALPLVSRSGTPLGMLNTHWRETKHRPTEKQLGFLDLIARQAADLIEQRQAQAVLRASEERLRRVLEADTVAVLFFDAQGILIDANEAFLHMLGYRREQVEERALNWQKLTPPEWHPASEEQMRKVKQTGRIGPYEKEYFHADGSRLVMLFAGRDLGDGTNVEFAIDITARRHAEQALRESEERFRRFGEASQDILWMRDAETLQWSYLTPAFETIYGLGRDEALKGDNYRSWLDLVLPEDRERAAAEIARVRAGEQVVFEYRIRRPSDGRICWLRNTDFPIADASGKVVMIGGIGHDVTELRASEQRSRLLLAELQHRVRNIMAMIRSVARRTGDSVETVEDYVQHLEGRIGAMARTQAMLTREVHAAVDLESLVLDELNMQAAEPRKFAVTGPDVALPPKAAEVLGLALHELATNSIKYGALCGKDGRVDVRWALLDGEAGEGAPRLSLIWSEFGVRFGGGARRQGFGTELITQRVPYELQGTGTMEFRPTGLVATIEFPLTERPSILQTDEGMSR